MPKFRKKPVVISAEQWFPDHHVEGVQYIYSKPIKDVLGFELVPLSHEMGIEALHDSEKKAYVRAVVKTLEGDHTVTPGDFIVTGVEGEKYPCKERIFKATYESVEE